MYITRFNVPSPDQILNTWLVEGHVICTNTIYTITWSLIIGGLGFPVELLGRGQWPPGPPVPTPLNKVVSQVDTIRSGPGGVHCWGVSRLVGTIAWAVGQIVLSDGCWLFTRRLVWNYGVQVNVSSSSHCANLAKLYTSSTFLCSLWRACHAWSVFL